jgi:hypothetical protein
MSRKNARQEESEEEDEFADTDPDKRYCYCQLKWDGATPMVACDSCNNWFHFVCAFLDPEHPPDVWYCDPCEEKQGVRCVGCVARAVLTMTVVMTNHDGAARSEVKQSLVQRKQVAVSLQTPLTWPL